MLKLLAILGYILLGLIIILTWVIIVPRNVYVEYTVPQGISVKINLLFFKITLYSDAAQKKKEEKQRLKQPKKQETNAPQAAQEPPEQTKTQAATQVQKANIPLEVNQDKPQITGKEQNKKAAEQKIKEKAEKPKKNYFENLPQGMELIKQVLKAVKGVFKILLNGIKFKDVSFTVPLYSQDAYQTQKTYSTVTTAFYAFNIFLQQYVKIYYKKPIFIADFANLYSNATYFYCKIQTSPSIILVVGWYLFNTYRKITKQTKTDNTDKEI